MTYSLSATHQLPHSYQIEHFAQEPGGKWATQCQKIVALWDKTGTLIFQSTLESGSYSDIALSKTCVVATSDKAIYAWDLEGRQLFQIKDRPHTFVAISSDDNTIVAAGSNDKQGHIGYIYDRNGVQKAILKHTTPITRVLISSNGNTVITHSSTTNIPGEIHTWDAEEGATDTLFSGALPSVSPHTCDLTCDGLSLFTHPGHHDDPTQDTCNLYNRLGEVVSNARHKRLPRALSNVISENGHYAVVATSFYAKKNMPSEQYQECLFIWDTRQGTCTPLQNTDVESHAGISADGNIIVTSNNNEETKMSVWNPHGNLVSELTTDKPIVSLAISADGTTIFAFHYCISETYVIADNKSSCTIFTKE